MVLVGCDVQFSNKNLEHDIAVSVFESGTGKPVIGAKFYLISNNILNKSFEKEMNDVFIRSAKEHKKKFCKILENKYRSEKPWWVNYTEKELSDYLVARKYFLSVIDCDYTELHWNPDRAREYVKAIEELEPFRAKIYRNAFFYKLYHAYYEFLETYAEFTMSTGIDGTLCLTAPTDEYFFIITSNDVYFNKSITHSKLLNVDKALKVNLSSYDHDKHWDEFTIRSQLDDWLGLSSSGLILERM